MTGGMSKENHFPGNNRPKRAIIIDIIDNKNVLSNGLCKFGFWEIYSVPAFNKRILSTSWPSTCATLRKPFASRLLVVVYSTLFDRGISLL